MREIDGGGLDGRLKWQGQWPPARALVFQSNQGTPMEEAQFEAIERLAMVAGLRHDNSGQHNERVAQLAAAMAREFGDPVLETLIERAAALHDIGKIGIPDSILLKPGPLSEVEWVTMKTHTTIGAAILSCGRSDCMRLAEEIAMSHHERWDGLGYPRGLRGEEIPLAARIVTIADVYDALSSDRPYRGAFSVDQSFRSIEQGSGTLFDPALVKVFSAVIDEWSAVMGARADTGESPPSVSLKLIS
jgi:putative two-component system response regulator